MASAIAAGLRIDDIDILPLPMVLDAIDEAVALRAIGGRISGASGSGDLGGGG